MNFYPTPPVIQAEVYVQIPASLRCSGQPTEWLGGSATPASDIFLEGPTWRSSGDLYVTDIPYGRILKIDPLKQVTECVRYDGEPNGLALRDDGCMLVADYKQVRNSSHIKDAVANRFRRVFFYSTPKMIKCLLS